MKHINHFDSSQYIEKSLKELIYIVIERLKKNLYIYNYGQMDE